MPAEFVLFDNTEKRTSEKAPAWKGRTTITAGFAQEVIAALKASGGADVDFEIAAWEKQGAKCGLFFSGRIAPEQKREGYTPRPAYSRPSGPPQRQPMRPAKPAPPPDPQTPFDLDATKPPWE
jgi:hypothetical protein